MNRDLKIDRIEARAYKIPTDRPESDGTLEWHETTLVTVYADCAGKRGFGYGYSDSSAVDLIEEKLGEFVVGSDPMQVEKTWELLNNKVRNLGDTGVASMAIASVDNALWDLKARLLDLPLTILLGKVRDRIEAYGSGGFTSYSDDILRDHFESYARDGFRAVKMKIGRNAQDDARRVAVARAAVGDGVALYVDANGAYTPYQALEVASMLEANRVSWFEEPVNHLDRKGLALVRNRIPPGIPVSVGEYGFTLEYFRELLGQQCCDILQADATRCGITGFMKASVLSEAFGIPFSAHTAPSIHVHCACAASRAMNIEYFYDHVRIEKMLLEGAAEVREGMVSPDMSRPGLGLELKEKDAEQYRIT